MGVPYLYDWYINLPEHSVCFKVSPIHPQEVEGILLGYRIIYFPVYQPQNDKTVQIAAHTTEVTLKT